MPFVAEGGAVLSGASGTKTLNFNTITGHTVLANETVIIFTACDNSQPEPFITSAGWTDHVQADAGASGPSNYVAYKKMGGTPDTTVDFNYTTGLLVAVGIQIWSGLGPANGTWTRSTAGTTGMPDSPAMITTVSNCILFSSGHLDDDDVASTCTPPTGYTNDFAVDTGQGSTTIGATAMIASRVIAVAASENPPVWGGTGSDAWFGYSFAFEPSSGITGNLGITEAADTLSAAAVLALQASAPVTEAADTLSSTSTISLQASASLTEAADTLSALGTPDRIATLSASEAADTLSSASVLTLVATLTSTEGADTLSAAGVLPISAAVAVTEAADTCASTATALIGGALSVAEASDTASATATLALSGTLGATEGADTSTSAAVLSIIGVLGATEVADTIVADGTFGTTTAGNLSVTESADTLASTAIVAIVGSVAVTEIADAISSAAVVPIVGSATIIEGADTLAATTVMPINGSVSVATAADTLVASALTPISGSLSATDAADTLASATVLQVIADVFATEGSDTLTATAVFERIGTLTKTEGIDTLSSSGMVVSINGSLTKTTAGDTLAATGTAQIVITLTGHRHFNPYDVTDPAADRIDATAMLATQNNNIGAPLNNYPFHVHSTNRPVIVEGGVINGEVNLTTEWTVTYENSAAVFLASSPDVIVRNWRVTRVWDAFRFTGVSAAEGNWTIEDCWVDIARDDAIENDSGLGGTIRNCLFDNVFSGISVGGAGTDIFNQDITMDGMLLRMKSYLYENSPSVPLGQNHGAPFKMNTNISSANNPNLSFFNCYVAIEKPDHFGSSRLPVAWDNQVAASGNYYLNLSDTNFAGGYPLPGSGWTVQQGATARATWDAARAAWLTAHYPSGASTPVADRRPSWHGFRLSGSTGTKLIALPGPRLRDDILYLQMARDDVMSVPTILSSGWTSIENAETGTDPARLLAYKRMGTTPDTGVSLAYTAGDIAAGFIWLVRGVDPSTAIDATPTLANNTTGSPNAPSYTTVTNGAMRIAAGMLDDDDVASTAGGPAGWSGFTAYDTGQASTTIGATVMAAYLISPTAGAVDPGAFTGGTDAWRATHFAFRPELEDSISADVSVTTAGDTLSSGAKLALAATAAVNEAAGTLSSAATLAISGSLSRTESADTLSALTLPERTGTVASTAAGDTVTSASVLAVTGSVTSTAASDTLSSGGTVPIGGTLAYTEVVDALSAAGVMPLNGALAVAEGADTASAAATLEISATLAKTEAADALTSAGVGAGIGATLAKTDAPDTLASVSVVPINGTLAKADAADTLSSGSVLSISGALARTTAGDTLGSTSSLAIVATATVTENPDTLSASSDTVITGSLSSTANSDTLTSIGVVPIRATAASTSVSDTLAASGTVPITATLAITGAPSTLSSSADLVITGAVSIIEASDTLISVSTALIGGSLNSTEVADTLSAAGALPIAGVLTNTDAQDLLSADGSSLISGSLDTTDAADTLLAYAGAPNAATLSVTEAADTLGSVAGISLYGAVSSIVLPDTVISTGFILEGWTAPRHRIAIPARMKRRVTLTAEL